MKTTNLTQVAVVQDICETMLVLRDDLIENIDAFMDLVSDGPDGSQFYRYSDKGDIDNPEPSPLSMLTQVVLPRYSQESACDDEWCFNDGSDLMTGLVEIDPEFGPVFLASQQEVEKILSESYEEHCYDGIYWQAKDEHDGTLERVDEADVACSLRWVPEQRAYLFTA